MADNYTQFSFELRELSLEEMAWWQAYLKEDIKVEVESGDDNTRCMCKLEDKDTTLRIGADEYGMIGDLCDVLQASFKAAGSDRIVSFSWANTCSDPRSEESGGGAAAVSARQCAVVNTYTVADKMAEWMKNLPESLSLLPLSSMGYVSSD